VHDVAGEFLTTNLPFSIDGSKPSAGGHVSALGGDNAAVLAGLLGIDALALQRLRDTGVVAGA
jgi:crotonobetainyl-CoA:carnitine CoA-transferase CaiB-like acyl-CoA transferase